LSPLDELRWQLEESRRYLLLTLGQRHGTAVAGPPPDAAGLFWTQRRRDRAEVDAALARLGAATFGTCERCGRPILLARLRAMPTLRICLGCETEASRCDPEDDLDHPRRADRRSSGSSFSNSEI
jgi:hypothetical protein